MLLLGCDIATGPYYDSISENCVFSCPRGFQGVYATGTCDPGEFKRDIICRHNASLFYGTHCQTEGM